MQPCQTNEQNGLTQHPKSRPSATSDPLELHPLGPIEVGTLQRDYKEKIAAIRAICLSFAQGPLHQSLNGGDSSLAPAFRKYSTLLKVFGRVDWISASLLTRIAVILIGRCLTIFTS